MYALLRSFMRQMQADYLRWSLHALLHWDSRGLGPALTLHGTRDRVFPLGRRQVDYRIAGGPHFMVYTHAGEVGAVLTELLTAAHAS